MKIRLLCLLALYSSVIFGQRIGINTSSPNTFLDVNGSVSYREGTPLSVSNGANNNVTLADMSVYRITAPTAAFTITGFTGGVDGRLLVLINATSFTMTLSHQSGSSSAANQINVGDGFNINIGSNGSAVLFYNSTLQKWVVVATSGETTDWLTSGNRNTSPSTNFLGTIDAQDLVVRTNNTERMRVASGGKIGIGNNNPSSIVTIQNETTDDANDDISIFTYSNSSTPAYRYLKARGTAASPSALGNSEYAGGFNCYVYNGSSFINATGINTVTASDFTTSFGSEINFSTARSGSISDRMRLTSTGRLGIGTTAPDQLLSVNGNASKSGGGSWATFSDARIKRNVRPFTEGLSILERIRPVWFQYNGKSGYADTTKNYVGVVAQEVETVAPYMVEKTQTQSFDDQRVYDATALTYILVNSVKELKTENDSLRAEIAQLKQALNDKTNAQSELAKRLDNIEALLNKPKTNGSNAPNR